MESARQAYQVGEIFGAFQKMLLDLPGPRLHETIPQFHNVALRFQAFQESLERDRHNRARQARPEIDFALRQSPLLEVLPLLQAQGRIPERITHNDTKLNNVLLDADSGESLCVIDLDTVMPGTVLYDFGDMMRTCTSRSAEDERDLSKVRLERPLFDALVTGYLSSAGEFLTRTEREQLVFSGKLITFEMGIRFLTDYLSGDVYYKTARPGQNLDRCRTQFRLIESISQQEEELVRFVQSLA